MTRRFKAEVLSGHKECAIEVPFDPEIEWGISRNHSRADDAVTKSQQLLNVTSSTASSCVDNESFFMLVDTVTMRTTKISVGDVVKTTVCPVKD